MKNISLHKISGTIAAVALIAIAVPMLHAAFSVSPIAGQTCTAGYYAGYGYGYDCVPASSGGGGGGGGGSYTAPTPVAPTTTGNVTTGVTKPDHLTDEVWAAYQFAFANKIITESVSEAKLTAALNRQELAKLAVNFAKNVLGKKELDGVTCDISHYADADKITPEFASYIKQACEMGIMGRRNHNNEMISAFRPFDLVPRAEFGAVLSRILYGNSNDAPENSNWFRGHLRALKAANIMSKINTPYATEIRQWVLVMMHRAAK